MRNIARVALEMKQTLYKVADNLVIWALYKVADNLVIWAVTAGYSTNVMYIVTTCTYYMKKRRIKSNVNSALCWHVTES